MKRVSLCTLLVVVLCVLALALAGCGEKAAPGAEGGRSRDQKREDRDKGREEKAPPAPVKPAAADPAVIARNETSAVGNIRAIVGAEVVCLQATGAYGTLDALVNATPEYLVKSFASGKKDGYVFTITAAGNKFTCTAVPETPGQTGVKRYFTDESGVIRHTTDGTEPTASSPPVS